MKRLMLAVVAVVAAACNDTIPGQCKTDSECRSGDQCYLGFCVIQEVADGGDPDAAIPDGGGWRDGGFNASAPAPGGKWEAVTSGGAFGSKVMENSRNKVMGALSEPTPGLEAGQIEMKNSSHHCIGGFNAALHPN